MKTILTFIILFSAFNLWAYDWKNKPDKFFYRVGEYAKSNEQFLWLENKKKLIQIQFHSDIMLKGPVLAELNSNGFYIGGELKCKIFDNFNVKYGDGSEEDWFIDVNLNKNEVEDLKKQFRKYRVCDVPPLYNVVEKKDTYRYIAPAKLVDGQRSVFETNINGRAAYFQYKGGRILYSLEWRKKRHEECMERIIDKNTQKLMQEVLSCIKKSGDYMKCGISGYSRNQCELEELYGYPKGPEYTGDKQSKSDQEKIQKAIKYTLEDALEVGNGEDYEIAKCELMDNGDAQIRFYKNKGEDDIWFWWNQSYNKGGEVHLHFSACPE